MTRPRINKKIITVVIALIVIFYITQLAAAYQNARQMQAAAPKLMAGLYTYDWPKANFWLSDITANISQLDNNLARLWPFNALPVVKDEYQAAKNMFAAAEAAVASGKKLLALLNPEDIKKKGFLTVLAESEPLWQELQDATSRALPLLSDAKAKTRIDKLRTQIEFLTDKLAKAQALIAEIKPWPSVLPSLFGQPDEKTYLLLLQNNNELRPTGGFIGTIGILSLKDGKIAQFSTDNVYNLDEPAKKYIKKMPPAPITRFLKQRQWFLRDVNWDPDFPTTAQRAIQFYKDEGGPIKTFGGVIAFTPRLIQDLLAVTGPITVDSHTFTAENLVDLLQYEVGVGFKERGITVYNRKKIIDEAAKKLKERIINFSLGDWQDFLPLVLQDLDEKQMMFYFNDERAQKLVQAVNWDNSVRQADGDYFYVVDANLGSLKSDPNVDRTISYQLISPPLQGGVGVVPGVGEATLSITYANRGRFDWKTTRYRTYTRVYVPLGSTLIKASGNERAVDRTQEHGKTVFGAFISIEPSESETLSFTYRLPPALADKIMQDKKYALFIQKQAGAEGHNLALDITVPFNLNKITPNGILRKIKNNQAKGNWDLSIDRELTISQN